MIIVNRTQFLALPAGTVFAKYTPCYFGDLAIKEETWSTDFVYQRVADAVDYEDSGQFIELLNAAEYEGASIPMDFDCAGRDGMFDEHQLFAVFEPDDVRGLIARLQQALESSTR